MHISIALATMVATMLVSIRLAPLFLFAPVFGSMSVPPQFRMLLLLGISYLLTAALGLDLKEMPIEASSILRAIINEIILGAVIATVVMLGFAAFLFAGRLLDLQMGFGVAALIDFNSKAPTPLIGTALSMMAVMMFYLIDGHHMLLRGVAYSFEKFPLASGWNQIDIGYLISFAGSLFSFGFILVAPIVLILFLIDVGLAVMSRTMPQMNIFVIAISIKVFVGIILLALCVRYMGGITSKIFNSIFYSFERILT